MDDRWEQVVGAFHIHTRYSDGRADMEEILAAARRAGLDFVLISDHDCLAARREGWEGSHDGLDVLVATEITPHKRGHVLAMDVEDCAGYCASLSGHTLDAVAEQGGYALVAHPQGKHKPWLRIHHRPWYHWDHPTIRGMEIWSYTHDWVDAVAWWRFPRAHEVHRFPERWVQGPDETVLRMWDRLAQERRVAGLGGLDCHAIHVPIANVTIFPYERMFRMLRNHLFIPAGLSGPARIRALWQALAEGRCWVAHDILQETTGARCEARTPGGETLPPGTERPFEKGIEMTLDLPCEADAAWIANGVARLRERTRTLTAEPIGPGVYRFEARLDGRPWVFSNPFYLR